VQGWRACSETILLLRNPKKENLMTNMAESSKEDYGLKISVLPVMMMIIMMIRQ
jgi:hypothetical protein